MKKTKTIITALLIFLMCFSLCSCNMVSVNSAKDKNQVVATVGDNKITKGEVVDYVNFLEIMYACYGSALTQSEDEVLSYRKNVLDSIVEYYLIKSQDEYKVDYDDSELDENVDFTYSSLKGYADTTKEGAFDELLDKYGFTEETFKKTIRDYTYISDYIASFDESFKEANLGGKNTKKAIMEVNGEKVPAYVFYYYMIQKTIEGQITGNSSIPTEEKELKEFKEELLDTIATDIALIQRGQKEGYNFGEETVNDAMAYINYDSYYGLDSIYSFANDTYFITNEQYDEAKRMATLASLSQKELLTSSDVGEVSDKEIEKYFKENKDSFDKNTVSAMHILTEDKSLAKKIREEALKADSFEEVMEKYQNNEDVIQAGDLGEFKYSDMVSEFSAEAFKTEVGKVSNIVKTSYGYHVIYVYAKNDVGEPKLEDYKDQIENTILSEKQNETKDDYLKALLKDTKITNKVISASPYEDFMNELKDKTKVKTHYDRLK